MKIKNTKIIILIGLLISLFFGILNYIFTIKFTIPNTDINQQYLISDNFLTKGNFFYLDELDEKQPINERYIGIRGLLYFEKNGAFSPSSMPGMIILFTLFKGINNYLLLLINPIFIFILFIYLFKLISSLFPKLTEKQSLVVAITIILSSHVIYNGSFLFNNLATNTLFIVGLYYLIKVDRSVKYGILFSMIAGTLIWFRYPIIIFYLPFIIYKTFFPVNWNILKNIHKYIFTFLLFFIPLYFYQVKYFGGFLNFNNPTYRLNHFVDTVQSSSFFSFDIFLHNIYFQLLLVSPLIILGILGFFYFRKTKHISNSYIIVLGLIVVFQLFFYLGKIWSGYYFENGGIGSSYTRYLLLSWIIIYIIGLVYLLKTNYFSNFSKIVLILIFLVFNITHAVNSQMGLRYFYSTSNTISNLKKSITNVLTGNTVLLTNFDDKYFYGIDNVKLLPYIAINPNDYFRVISGYMKRNNNYNFYIYRENKDICSLFNCQKTEVKNLYKLSIKNEQN